MRNRTKRGSRSSNNNDKEKKLAYDVNSFHLNSKQQSLEMMATPHSQKTSKALTGFQYGQRPKQQRQRRRPWLIPKNKQSISVTDLIRLRQEEIWNDFARQILRPLLSSSSSSTTTEHNAALVEVLKSLFFMGISVSVLEHAAFLILGDSHNDQALPGLARYLAYGVTRVPTPAGISQRLALLHVICTFREAKQQRNIVEEQHILDPVELWYFLMGQGAGDEDDGTNGTIIYLAWQSGEDPLYVWCWELRALVMRVLANDEQERRMVQATAEQVAHAVSMAAVTVELSLNESTEFVCYGMAKGCEWIKMKLGAPVVNTVPQDHCISSDESYFCDEAGNIEVEDYDKSSQVSFSTLSCASSVATSTATSVGAPSLDPSSVYSHGSSSTKKTKQAIVEETYTSHSRTIRQATESARQTTLFYVRHWREVSGQGLRKAAESSRTWATANVDANMQHWAYVDAVSKVGLASLGAMGILGEAIFRNTHMLLDHSTAATTDLIQHQFGPTAASLFGDVSWTALNIWRITLYVASLGTPVVFAKSVVKHASREELRQQQELEQTLRKQFGTTSEENQGYQENDCDYAED